MQKNSEMELPHIKKHCKLDHSSQELMIKAANNFNLSSRGYLKVLKLGRTIADMELRENIALSDITEALQYRKRPLKNQG